MLHPDRRFPTEHSVAQMQSFLLGSPGQFHYALSSIVGLQFFNHFLENLVLMNLNSQIFSLVDRELNVSADRLTEKTPNSV